MFSECLWTLFLTITAPADLIKQQLVITRATPGLVETKLKVESYNRAHSYSPTLASTTQCCA